jgi:hypothetical protein
VSDESFCLWEDVKVVAPFLRTWMKQAKSECYVNTDVTHITCKFRGSHSGGHEEFYLLGNLWKVDRRFGITRSLRFHWRFRQSRNQYETLLAGFLLGLLFNAEEGRNMCLRNIWLLRGYTAVYPRRHNPARITCCSNLKL